MSICSCYYVPTVSLWCVVHTRDIKHQHEVFFSFAWPFCYVVMSQVWTRLNQFLYKRFTQEIVLFSFDEVAGQFSSRCRTRVIALKCSTSTKTKFSVLCNRALLYFFFSADRVCSNDIVLVADKTGSIGKDDFKLMKGFLPPNIRLANHLSFCFSWSRDYICKWARRA